MILLFDPSSQVKAYLGIQLDSQHKYIKVSRENKTLLAKDSIVDDIEKNKRQIQLFEKVIDKLTNTTGYKQYISVDSKMDVKAEIITGVFFENCKKSGCELPELLNFHRNALANLLTFHIRTCLMAPSYQAHERLQIPTSPSSSETISTTARPRSNTEEEVINDSVSPLNPQTALSTSNPPHGNRLQETNPLTPRSVSLTKKNPGSVKDRTISTKTSINLPSSIAPSSFNGLSPEKETTSVRATSFKSGSFKREKTPRKPSTLNRGRSQEAYLSFPKSGNLSLKNLGSVQDSIVSPIHRKLEAPENAQELVAQHLSEGCLSYCYYHWLYRLTNNEDHKYRREQSEKKISVYDQFCLDNNDFLAEPKLKFILQEQTLRALNTAEKNHRVFVDVDRTFGYTGVCSMNDKDSFQYETIEIADQVQSTQHNLLQFERFLLFVIKRLEGDDSSLTIQPILSIWKACVKYATEEEVTNESFLNAGEKFLYEIADHSRMQEERGIKFKLRKLISTFNQIIYTIPSAALTDSLLKIKCSQKIHNRSNIIKFITPSKVEIYVRNTTKFSTSKCTDFANLTIENKLSANLSDFTSWSSEITVQALPSSQANRIKFEKLVIEPLTKIGLEVHQTKPLTLRKANIDASSSSSSAVDTDKNSSNS